MEQKSFLSKITEDTAIKELFLSDEMVKQPGLFAYYASLYAAQMKKSSSLKVALGVLEGKIHQELKNEELSTGKKLTDKDKEKRLKEDVRWVDGRTNYDSAEADTELLRCVLDALKQKKDMLVQLSLRQRDEIKSETEVKNQPDNLRKIVLGQQ